MRSHSSTPATPSALTPVLTIALKEWAVAVNALAKGETMLLLRKGGIKENQGKFSPAAEQVVLLPTFEHQKPELLKPAYREAVHPVETGWHPDSITLTAWATITDIFLTHDEDKVAALSEFHIWLPTLAQERLKWKPQQPLYVLALRAYRFSTPVTLPWDEAYGGCRSWVSLKESMTVEGSEAAMPAGTYQEKVKAIANILEC
ncbi:MAG: DUF1802 family protein [Phormidesmis sp.]